MSDETFDSIVYKIKNEKGLELAAFQPRFIVDQVVATCRFMEQPPHFEPRYIEYALNNLRVHRHPTPQQVDEPQPQPQPRVKPKSALRRVTLHAPGTIHSRLRVFSMILLARINLDATQQLKLL